MRAKTKIISEFEFWLVGNIDLKRTANGMISEYNHNLPEQTLRNKHAVGPFCTFNLPAAPSAPGVYAIFVDEEMKYIGECVDLAARFGSGGYGHISPRNLHIDGQSTNCKLNSRILTAAKSGQVIQVWFLNTTDHKSTELKLLKSQSPIWNGKGTSNPSKQKNIEARTKKPPKFTVISETQQVNHGKISRSDFDKALREFFLKAESNNLASIQLTSKDLHLEVGEYPGPNHRMPTCCKVMRDAMRVGDKTIAAPPKGNGATLRIEYHFPRN